MRNKGILWFFVVLLAITTLYCFSLGLVANRFEKSAGATAQLQVDSLATIYGWNPAQQDSAKDVLTKRILRDSADAKVYPILGNTYKSVKKDQLNLGLDLKGGMSVTLEVSIADLFMGMSDYTDDKNFTNAIKEAREMQKRSSGSYVNLFEQAWKNQNAGFPLWRIFSLSKSSGLFPMNATDKEVFDVLAVEADNAISNTENVIKKRVDNLGVSQANVAKQTLTGRIIVDLPGVDDREYIRGKLKSTANLEFWETYKSSELVQLWQGVNDTIAKTFYPELFVVDTTSKDTTSTALLSDSTSVAKKDSTQLAKSDVDTTSAVDTSSTSPTDAPNEELSEEEKKKLPLINKLSPMLNMDRMSGVDQCLVATAKVSDTSDVNRMLAMPQAKAKFPKDLRLLWGAKPQGGRASLYAIKDPSLKGIAPLDGKSIESAESNVQDGQAVVNMTMDSETGTPIWRSMTEKASADNKRPIAVVMDGLVYSAPNVSEPITDGESRITFGQGPIREQLDEATDLSNLLKAGSIPARITIIDEVTVGPTLGEANIKAGIWSFVIAFVVILAYMIFYYAWAGLAANVALITNLFFMMGALIAVHGSLTLPGIAGIVLTMGMAVDANVLIYERVKEELRLGKGIQAAMRDGFIKAISAIIDGNVTTLLTGIVLFIVGTGPIKGFATTLIIGIFTTLFTAIVVARLILYRRLESKRPITFSSKITKNWFTNVNFDFVGKRKMFYMVSLVIVGAGIISMFVRQPAFNWGVDFVGGTSFKVAFDQPVEVDVLRGAFAEVLVENGQASSNTVQSIDNTGKDYKIITNYMVSSEVADADSLVQAKANEAIAKAGVPYKINETYRVDPTMTDDFRREALWATIVGLLLVGIYIFIRFRMWDYAVGAIAALAHDALVVVAAFTLLNGIVPFSLEVNQAFVGAILTVIGFSINDTVVIFDRIREYMRNRKNAEPKAIINDALNSTLGRSINTSMTVLLTLLVMFIFGSDDIRGFTFAMIIGVISGSYSTLFIASPIVVDIRNWQARRKAKQIVEEKNVATATV
ncbi:MAG: protein translocase subunit SecD [Flavobacteriales bacterium]|nr:protein translocase subunit SecD [Flavobacteriales bacterium]